MILVAAALSALLLALLCEPIRTQIEFRFGKLRGGQSVSDRVQQYGKDVASRLKPDFEKAGVSYPPADVAYVAFKDTKILEVYARSVTSGPWRYIRTYPILRASGTLGPKLKEGDRQVPEGIYRSESLNPNSRYHLAILVSYPNAFDLKMAAAEGRSRLGGDIMIHGSSVSIGCLAMGNTAAEDLFVLVAHARGSPTKIIISPTDFRRNPNYVPVSGPPWLESLYKDLRRELQPFTLPPDNELSATLGVITGT